MYGAVSWGEKEVKSDAHPSGKSPPKLAFVRARWTNWTLAMRKAAGRPLTSQLFLFCFTFREFFRSLELLFGIARAQFFHQLFSNTGKKRQVGLQRFADDLGVLLAPCRFPQSRTLSVIEFFFLLSHLAELTLKITSQSDKIQFIDE